MLNVLTLLCTSTVPFLVDSSSNSIEVGVVVVLCLVVAQTTHQWSWATCLGLVHVLVVVVHVTAKM